MAVIARNLAGSDHAVLTVKESGFRYRRAPCSDCPWRRDAVGIFPPEAFRLAANVGLDGALCRDAATIEVASHTFGCHQSGKDKPATCAGYILRGDRALGWRIAVALKRFDPTKVSDNGVELFDSYEEMAAANGA